MTARRIEAVEGRAGGQAESRQATGFLMNHQGQTFVVTNHHVLIDNVEHFRADRLVVEVHRGWGRTGDRRKVTLQLYEPDGAARWLQHPLEAENVDLAVVPIPDLDPGKDWYAFFTTKSMPSVGTFVPIGTNAMFLGFALDYHDDTLGFPVAHHAMVASWYGHLFRNRPVFLVDTDMRKGASGSPVVLPRRLVGYQSGKVSVGNFSPLLLGVLSEQRFLDDVDLGVAYAWYPGLLKEIIEQKAVPAEERTPAKGTYSDGRIF